MYGDCQVMPTMGGNTVIPPDNIFSSSPIQNPNFSFMPFHPFPPIVPKEEDGSLSMIGGKEEMLESGSGSDQAEENKSGNEQDFTGEKPPIPKRKRYHRHTAHQIQEMEAMFKECPHPDDKQRLRLSQELGLKPRQVKFWFQNRRTQMKAQQDRTENVLLRAENDTLKNENFRLQTELRSLVCPTCGGPVVLGGIAHEELRVENARLREELERVCCMASRFSGRQIQSGAPPGPSLMPPPSLDLDMNMYSRHDYSDQPHLLIPTSSEDGSTMPIHMLPEQACSFPENVVLMTDEDKALAYELAASSVSELVKMCTINEPLWIRNSFGKDVLNVDEYSNLFKWTKSDDAGKPKWRLEEDAKCCEVMRTEASRHSCVVIMNSITLVDAFLDAVKWIELFPSLVARAKTVQVLSPGSGPNGCLLLMYAELQVLSPLVGTREAYFFRYIQQNVEEGTWAIVDFPIHCFRENSSFQPPFLSQYRRNPSGCLIQDMPNGYSRVTWVEHVEVEEKHVHHIFSQHMRSGTAFGAQRWLAVLRRQCERVASLMARNIADLGVIPSPEARRNLMRLSQRMMKAFCVNMSTSSGQSWTALSDSPDDTVRFTTRKVTEPGQLNGLIFCAVSTTWLPYSHLQVFDLLRDEQRRFQLDVLSNGNSLHEVAHIANGSDPGNCISLLRINMASNSAHHVELMLQESSTDESGSLVVYSTLDVDSIQLAMNGEDPTCIPLLPLGFSIIPVEPDTAVGNSAENGHPSSNCLLTVGLQVLASPVATAKINLSSVSAINSHLRSTVQQISTALSNSVTLINNGKDHEIVDFNVVPPTSGLLEELDAGSAEKSVT